MIGPLWPPRVLGVARPLDPALAAEMDDASLREALRIAEIADRVVLVAELLLRGRRL